MTQLHDDRILTALRDADPLAAGDADLAPDGAMAHRVLRAAQRTAPPAALAPAPTRRARRVGVAVAATGCLAAAGVAVGVGLDGGGTTAPPDARAALVRAAQRTASFTSGRIAWHMTFDDPRSTYDMDVVNDVRYDGADVDTHAETKEHGLGGDPGLSVHADDYRLVGGRAYLRSGDTPFKEVTAPGDGGASGAGQWQAVLTAAKDLGALARRAPDVHEDHAGGRTTFRATVDGQAISGPLGNQWATAGPGVVVAVAVGDDDVVQTITIDKGPRHVDIAFSDLGRPQGITAP